MAPFFLPLFVTLLLFFIQGAFSFDNFFFHRVLQNISLFLWGRDSLKIINNIIICIIIFKEIVQYSKTLRFVRGIINSFKKRSNFIGTLKSNKFFNLLCIIKIIIFMMQSKLKNLLLLRVPMKLLLFLKLLMMPLTNLRVLLY